MPSTLQPLNVGIICPLNSSSRLLWKEGLPENNKKILILLDGARHLYVALKQP